MFTLTISLCDTVYVATCKPVNTKESGHIYKAGEKQPRAPGQIGEHGPPVPLDSHADGHTKVYFLIAKNYLQEITG